MKKLNFLSARKPKTCGEWLISAEAGAIPSSRHHWIRYMFLAMNSDFLPTGASFLMPSLINWNQTLSRQILFVITILIKLSPV